MLEDIDKAREITAYFFSQLNVDDLYSEKEFEEFAKEVEFMITTD